MSSANGPATARNATARWLIWFFSSSESSAIVRPSGIMKIGSYPKPAVPRGSVAIYFVPVVAMVLGVAVLDETISWSAILGMALVLAGAWLTSRREK